MIGEAVIETQEESSVNIERFQPNNRMSQAVVHGGVVQLAGQVAGEAEGVTAQTEAILAKIDRLLAEVGSSKSQLLSAQIILADITDFDAMNAVWEGWIDPANPPARATIGAALALPEFRVEIIVSAAVS
jgi:enamine deaminase RidA (YjgF/YER057c/UK114 family)